MELDTPTTTSLVGAFATIGLGIMGYGKLKAEVASQKERADKARDDRGKLFEEVGRLKTQTEVQESRLTTLQGENHQLFRLHEETTKSISTLGTTLSGLAKDVHYIRDSIREFKKDGQ